MRFRLAVLLLVLAFAFPAEAAKKPAEATKMPDVDSLRCPDTYKGGTLNDVDVFQGAPGSEDYLINEGDGWDIQNNRTEGQKFYLACHYGKDHPDAILEIPRNIDFCTPIEFNVDCR